MSPKILLCLVFCVLHWTSGIRLHIGGLNRTRLCFESIGIYYNYYYYNEERVNVTCESDSAGYLYWILPNGDETNHFNTLQFVYYQMDLNVYNNGTSATCVFLNDYKDNDQKFIKINFFIITRKQHLQLSGLDAERQTLQWLDGKGLTYNYTYYAGEEIRVTCASEEQHTPLKWEFFHSDGKHNDYTQSRNSPIVYTKKLEFSDNGAYLNCLCMDCKNTDKFFRVYFNLKLSKNGLYLYGLDRKRLTSLSNVVYIYQYYDGEEFDLYCAFYELRRMNTQTRISISFYITYTDGKIQFLRNFVHNLPNHDNRVYILLTKTLRAEDSKTILKCVAYVNNAQYAIAMVTLNLNNSLIESVNGVTSGVTSTWPPYKTTQTSPYQVSNNSSEAVSTPIKETSKSKEQGVYIYIALASVGSVLIAGGVGVLLRTRCRAARLHSNQDVQDNESIHVYEEIDNIYRPIQVVPMDEARRLVAANRKITDWPPLPPPLPAWAS